MTVLPKYLALLPMLAAATFTAAAAQASSDDFMSNGRAIEVRYKDLDLSKDADRRQLDLRIRRAAVKVCPDSTLRGARACQLLAIDHVRAPIEAAIAKANSRSGEAYADAGAAKPMGAAQ